MKEPYENQLSFVYQLTGYRWPVTTKVSLAATSSTAGDNYNQASAVLYLCIDVLFLCHVESEKSNVIIVISSILKGTTSTYRAPKHRSFLKNSMSRAVFLKGAFEMCIF